MDLSYLELEGHGQGIIMEDTRPLLLGPFYLIKWPVDPNILAASVNVLRVLQTTQMDLILSCVWTDWAFWAVVKLPK